VEIKGTLFVTALYEKREKVEWDCILGLNVDQLEQQLHIIKTNHQQISLINSYKQNGVSKFVLVWKANNDNMLWELVLNSDGQQFQQLNTTYESQGYDLSCMSSYFTEGQFYFAGLWTKEPFSLTKLLRSLLN